jgi:3-isopropylmalate/(R)-2-methylmalate dehydratase small subunit
MSISKVSTLTSGVLAIAEDVKKNGKESLDINIVKAGPEHGEKILVVDVESEKVSNYDEVVQSIHKNGFGVVVSDVFTKTFSAKALNYGILTIEVSRNFLKNIITSGQEKYTKLFVDFKGQEVMIVNTGEKEFFQLSDYYKESLENGNDDIDNLYNIWNGMEEKGAEEIEPVSYLGD